MTISKNLALDGNGHSVTLDGTNTVQVLLVNTGVSFTLNDVTVAHGTANFGGGLENKGALTITNSTFSHNYASYNGGGVINLATGMLSITNSTFIGNQASISTGTGAGLDNQGTARITNSTFTGNSDAGSTAGAGGIGGGLSNQSGSTVAITGSTFSDNAASGGSAIYDFGVMTITNTTISGNSATGDSGAISVTNNGGTLTLTNSTIAGNSIPPTTSVATRAANITNSGAVTFANTIVADGINGDNCNLSTLNGASAVDNGYNLDSGTTCGFSGAKHDLSSTTPMLGSLANNGGLTQTMALLPGSPAIDAGGTASNGCPATDQRGVSRPQGTACDVGAYEFVATTTTTLNASPSAVVAGQSVQLCATVTPTNNSGMPTGNIVFKDGSATLGTATLIGGKACLSMSSLAVGTHGITATYAGSGRFSGSTSAPTHVIVGVYGQDVMGNSAGNAPGTNVGNAAGNTSAHGATGPTTGSGQANGNTQHGAPGHPVAQTQPGGSFALWLALGILVIVLGLGGVGVVAYRARRATAR